MRQSRDWRVSERSPIEALLRHALREEQPPQDMTDRVMAAVAAHDTSVGRVGTRRLELNRFLRLAPMAGAACVALLMVFVFIAVTDACLMTPAAEYRVVEGLSYSFATVRLRLAIWGSQLLQALNSLLLGS